MSGTQVVVAQLGCGYWGPNLLRNFASQPNCKVKWVAEQSAARRAFVEQQQPGCRTTADWEEVLRDPEVQAVIIATPASTHAALATAALEAGKHVFVEKPLATTTADADKLVKLAAARQRVLMVGHTFLYNAAVRYLKKQIDDGQLGQVYYLYSQRLNLGQVRADVNAWWNLAPHDVSILLYLMNGELPVSVGAYGVAHIQKGIEDVVFATVSWARGIKAHVQVSWLDPGKTRKLTVVGSRKMVVYDDMADDKITIYDKGVDKVPKIGERMDFDSADSYQIQYRTGDILIPRIDFKEPLKVESGHFLECVTMGKTPLTGPGHARDVVAILEAGEQSLRRVGRSRRWRRRPN